MTTQHPPYLLLQRGGVDETLVSSRKGLLEATGGVRLGGQHAGALLRSVRGAGSTRGINHGAVNGDGLSSEFESRVSRFQTGRARHVGPGQGGILSRSVGRAARRCSSPSGGGRG